MAVRNIDVFDSSLQKTNLWIKGVESEIHSTDRPRAYSALRAVLHALRDCMPVDETAKFSSQMPLLVRGVFFDGWKPRRKPRRYTKDRFLRAIGDALRGQPGLDGALAARAVFRVVEEHLSPGEVRAIRFILPREIRQFWSELSREEAEPAIPPERPAPSVPGPYGAVPGGY